MHGKLRMPSPGLVVGLLALIVAIGGSAIAGGRGSNTGRIVGYAKVKVNGDVVGKRSLNVRDANVFRDSTNPYSYCFKNLDFTFKGGQVTIDYGGPGSLENGLGHFARGNPYGECSGAGVDAQVVTGDDTGVSASTSQPFYVQFYK